MHKYVEKGYSSSNHWECNFVCITVYGWNMSESVFIPPSCWNDLARGVSYLSLRWGLRCVLQKGTLTS